MSLVAESLDTASNPEVEAARRRALRALLHTPLLPAAGETLEEYNLVRQHFAWLKHWFATWPDWSLYIDKEVARLRKSPPDPSDETRPAIDRTSGSAFSRRRYALLCLALAALERSGRLTTLGHVAETVVEFVAADPALQAAGLVFDISNYDQRRDLVHVVRLLLELGLLRRIAGDEQPFLQRSAEQDSLYEIHRPVLAVMLNMSFSPSALEADQMSTSNGHDIPNSEKTRDQQIRARLARALLDDPVLYFEDLTGEERAYLDRHCVYLLKQIREATGLVPEIRREGIAMVDDAGNLTDIRLPEEGTDGQVGLLLASWLCEQLRDSPGTAVPFSAVEQHVRDLIQVHGSKWRKAVTSPGAEGQLAEDTLWRLRALRLVRITTKGVVPLAAIGRYRSG